MNSGTLKARRYYPWHRQWWRELRHEIARLQAIDNRRHRITNIHNDYDAVAILCDPYGRFDCSDALQALIDGTLLVPAGNFVLNKTIDMSERGTVHKTPADRLIHAINYCLQRSIYEPKENT